MATYDVAIVGAGPAGLICATELERLGEKTIIVEKDKKVGEPVECAGLFNIDGLKRLGIKGGDYVLNKVMGARFISTSGASAEIKSKEAKAYVVDRAAFDRFLADEYCGKLILGKEVTDARKTDGNYDLEFGRKSSKKNAVEAKNIVLATGNERPLRQRLGFKGPERYISTSQFEIDGVEADADFVELYVGSVAPGFFAWVIPVSEDVSRVGLGVLDAKEGVHHYMQEFLKRLKAKGRFRKKNKILYKSGGLIPVFEPELEIEHKNIYLVGDAAGQVKASTGGGVMMGGLAAKALAKAIHNGRDYSSSIADLTKELSNHLMIRNVINKFGDEQYEHMVEFLNKPEIKRVIEERGDMDFIGPLMSAVIKNPVLMMQAMRFFGRGLF